MNYEEVEPHLISYFILSFDERRKLMKETTRNQIWYVIERVSRGTEETFYNFLKALEESQDDANHKLMIHLQQDCAKTGLSTPLCQSEMLSTNSNSMENELVLGEKPIQSPVTLKNTKIEPSSYTLKLHHGLLNQRRTEQNEPLPTASPDSPVELQNIQTPPTPSSIDSAPDSQENWVIVHAHADITYYKNLTLLMEYVCDKVAESLTGTKSVQQLFDNIVNIGVSVKLAKAVYLAADPKTATDETRAAEQQIRCSYKLLMTTLHKLQDTRHPCINIDLEPILQEIGYPNDEAVYTECSVECLIKVVEKLNQTCTPDPPSLCEIL